MKDLSKIFLCIIFWVTAFFSINIPLMGQTRSHEMTFNIQEISSIEERVQLTYALMNHESLDCKMGNVSGELILTSKAKVNVEKVFSELRFNLLTELAEMSKEEKGEAFFEWKGKLDAELLYFIMEDMYVRGNTCETSDPFCTGTIYNFPAGTGGTSQGGPYYGCLSTQPNPAWYHMKISVGGALTINMYSTPSKDIDFICWGPFDDPESPCTAGLTAAKVVDCSYSSAAVENCDIGNAVVSKYYILLITNYSNAACNITFSKTGGTGETDCSILPPPITSNSPICVGDNLQLFAESVSGATYAWSGPGNWTSNQQNPTRSNATMNYSGTYSLIITVGGQASSPITTDVVVNARPIPDFTFTSACLGNPTQFTDASTVNPSSAQITSRTWNFGDGGTSTLQNPSHTYAQSGTYQVTLTAMTGTNGCPQTKTKSVVVASAPIANAGTNQTIPHGWKATLNGSASSGSGNYSYRWEPAAKVQNPNSATTQTVNLTANQNFTLTVTDNASSCSSSKSVMVSVTGTQFHVTANATPATICLGNSTQLQANASGGNAGNYTYSWTSNPLGGNISNPNISNPTVTPSQTTTYTVSVFDGQLTQTANVTVNIGAVNTADAGDDLSVYNGASVTLQGSASGTGYSVDWQPQNLLVDNTVIQPTTVAMTQTTDFTLTITNNASGCTSSDEMKVTVTGGALTSAATASPDWICSGESCVLDAGVSGGSGSYTYSWSPAASLDNPNSSSPIASPTSTTTYTVTVDDGSTTVTSDVTVTVGAMTVAEAGDNISTFNGAVVTLQGSVEGGSGNYSVNWEPSNLLESGATTLHPTTISLTETTTYVMTVTDNQSQCQSVDEVTVTIGGDGLTLNNLQANPPIICQGDETVITASVFGGSGQYEYHWSTVDGWTSTLQPSITVEPNQTTTYSLIISDGTNELNSSIEIEVKPTPIANAGNNQSINVGTSTILYGQVSGGSGVYLYQWTPVDKLEDEESQTLLQPRTALLNENVQYTFVVTDFNGCSSSSTTTVVTGGEELGVYVEASQDVICWGESVTLNTTPYGGSQEYTYSWTANNSSWTSDVEEPVVSPTQTTTYTLSLNDGFTTQQTSTTVTVNPLPVVNLVPPTYVSINDTITVCVLDSIHMDAGYGNNYKYLWQNGGSTQSQTAATNGTWIDFQTWSARVTDTVTGCYNQDTLTIFFNYDACVGVSETAYENQITVYPNPTKGHFNVRFDKIKGNLTLKVFSMHGLLQKELQFNADNSSLLEIDLSSASKGLYLLYIEGSNFSCVKKIIKN